MREDEASEVFGPPEEMKITPAAPGAPVTPKTPAEKQQAAAGEKKRRAMSGWYGFGYLGQEEEAAPPAVAEYLNKQESEFRPADVEKKSEILDKVTALNEAANAGLSPEKAITEAEGGSGIPPLVIGIGIVAVVGIVIFFALKKQ